MVLRLRQIVVAARDLRSTRAALEDELELPHVWADPGVAHFGLQNALYAVGDTFVEVVSPVRDDAPARRFLDRAGVDAAGYMVLVQTDEPIDAVRSRVDDLGVRVVFTAEGEGITGLHLHPADTGGTLLSIDRCDDPAGWPWAGPAWQAAPDRGWDAVVAADLAVPDPTGAARRWADLLGADADGDTVLLDRSELRFVSETSQRRGLCAADLTGVGDRGDVDVAGVTFRSRHV